MERNKARNTQIVYGICTNTGGKKDGTACSKCQNKEKQAIRASKEFICEECGEPLTKVDPPHPKPPKWLFVVLALVVIGVGAYFGLFKGSEKTNEPVTLSLNKEKISLYVGESDTLKATVLPEDAKQKVEYMSRNQDVVIVSDNGIVYAIHQGDAIVTATAQTKKGTSVVDSCKVKVSVKEVEMPNSQSKTNVSGAKTHTTISKQARYSNLSFGTLDGSLSYDNNATIMVTKQHTMVLKDAKQSTIVVYPGDELRQCRIRNGILESFLIVSKNENRESILDAQEKLN